MGYQKDIFSLIARLSGTKHKIVIDPHLCQFMGSLEGGVFLSQLLYWSDKGVGEWFYKSYRDWESEIFLSQYQVNRYAKKCVDEGFLETRLRKANGKPTVHYKVDGAKFLEAIIKFFNLENEIFDNGKSKISFSESQKFDNPITETTTEITSETTTEKKSSSRAGHNLTKPQDDDDDEMLAIYTAWTDEMEGKLTQHLKAQLRKLVADFDAARVIRGILTSSEAGGRSFRYVAKTVRNDAGDHANVRDSPYNALPSEPRRNYCPPGYEDIILGYSHDVDSAEGESEP